MTDRDSSTPQLASVHRTPRERWGTCCPFDPYCEHSYLDVYDLAEWLDRPITDTDATLISHGVDPFEDEAIIASPEPGG